MIFVDVYHRSYNLSTYITCYAQLVYTMSLNLVLDHWCVSGLMHEDCPNPLLIESRNPLSAQPA